MNVLAYYDVWLYKNLYKGNKFVTKIAILNFLHQKITKNELLGWLSYDWFFKPVYTMPAPTATAMAPELMVKRCKNPIFPFPIIMQSLDEHLFLAREMVVRRYPYFFVNFLKTVFTQTIKICL
jgi:hypothetical protein